RDREVAVAVNPMADIHHASRERERIHRSPQGGEAGLVTGPPQQLKPGEYVEGARESVIAAQLDLISQIDRRERLQSAGPRLTDVEELRDRHRGTERSVELTRWPGVDQVADVIAVPGHANQGSLVPQRLFKSVVPADARFRLQVGIGEERRREILEPL